VLIAVGAGTDRRWRPRPHGAADHLGAAGRGIGVAQQLGLGFVTTVDPTQGQQGIILGNFLTMLGITLIFATDLHHLVIAALTTATVCSGPARLRWWATSPRW